MFPLSSWCCPSFLLFKSWKLYLHGYNKAPKEVLLEIYYLFYTSQPPFPPVSALRMPPIFKYPTQKTYLHPSNHTYTPMPITVLPGLHFIVSLVSKYQRLLLLLSSAAERQWAAVSESVFSVCAFIWEKECWRDKRFKEGGEDFKKGVFVAEWGVARALLNAVFSCSLLRSPPWERRVKTMPVTMEKRQSERRKRDLWYG